MSQGPPHKPFSWQKAFQKAVSCLLKGCSSA